MSFVLTEEQRAIAKAASDLVARRAPVAHLRALRDSRDPVGFSREVWREMASVGFAGIGIPEAHGGSGLGLTELGLVLEACGRTLAPTPLVSTVLLGAPLVLAAGDEALRARELPLVASGERVIALAHEEGPHHAPTRVTTRAEPHAGGFRLTGEKSFVLDGHVADAFVVVARVAGEADDPRGLALFFVEASAPGVHATRLHLVDSRNAARVRFDGVTAAATLGVPGEAFALLDRVLDGARAGLAAEMLGGADEVFARTLAYLKERQQFGVAIGSFQALQHRAADLYCDLELTRSVVLEALRAIDRGDPEAARLVSAAKARAGTTFSRATAEAVQMHGGVGVTDELDIGFFVKRARVADVTFGDSAFHRDRFARLSGF